MKQEIGARGLGSVSPECSEQQVLLQAVCDSKADDRPSFERDWALGKGQVDRLVCTMYKIYVYGERQRRRDEE